MSISEKIRAIRVAKGLKQSDLAHELKIETSNYNRFENRGDKLTIEQARGIANALGVSLAELLELDQEFKDIIKALEVKNAELKEKVKEAIALRDEVLSIDKQLKLYDELFKQTKQRNKELELWARDVVSSAESGKEDAIPKMLAFIKSVYLSEDNTGK